MRRPAVASAFPTAAGVNAAVPHVVADASQAPPSGVMNAWVSGREIRRHSETAC
jgi:hypothetical protein